MWFEDASTARLGVCYGGNDDTAPHAHHCTCGSTWTCRKSDCGTGDACQPCEDNAVTTYLGARQPVLEPIEALFSARKDES